MVQVVFVSVKINQTISSNRTTYHPQAYPYWAGGHLSARTIIYWLSPVACIDPHRFCYNRPIWLFPNEHFTF